MVRDFKQNNIWINSRYIIDILKGKSIKVCHPDLYKNYKGMMKAFDDREIR